MGTCWLYILFYRWGLVDYTFFFTDGDFFCVSTLLIVHSFFTDGDFFCFTRHEPVGICGQIVPVSLQQYHLLASRPLQRHNHFDIPQTINLALSFIYNPSIRPFSTNRFKGCLSFFFKFPLKSTIYSNFGRRDLHKIALGMLENV